MPKKILVIDDELDLMDVTIFRLKKAGFEVLGFSKGLEGLEEARKLKPDLILLDYRLPDMLGSEVCKALKMDDETRAIPIIMISASTNTLTADRLKEIGADGFIKKPYDAADLVNQVTKKLGLS